MGAHVHPVPTLAMDAFLARPVALWRVPAHDILARVDRARREAQKPRRQRIEDALERLADLRDALIAKLDAMDADADLEPFLSASESFNQCAWAAHSADDREADGDEDEPYLSATERMDQRAWSLGGAHNYECEHDGEPEVGF